MTWTVQVARSPRVHLESRPASLVWQSFSWLFSQQISLPPDIIVMTPVVDWASKNQISVIIIA